MNQISRKQNKLLNLYQLHAHKSSKQTEIQCENRKGKELQKYHAMDALNTMVNLGTRRKKYECMGTTAEKETRLEKNRANMKLKYDAMDSPQKPKKNKQYEKSKSTKHHLDDLISNIHNKIRDGPYYICVEAALTVLQMAFLQVQK
jgi:hypothetical protein